MRVVLIEVGGKPAAGDYVILYYCAKRGGWTETSYLVRDGDNLDQIAEQLSFGVNTHWCRPLFEAKVRGKTISILCTDGANDVEVGWSVERNIAGVRVQGGSIDLSVSEG